ncbi:rho guanine nucleotide exchange factor 39 [Platysternon megacephalum]|uniref:Rho guanine nucleotide exchange factor 39 n=1 Tax=Platysternon megacephalum TaxID=55544 RepID=A0A4D9DXZ1_9SAUR|nr:rho guanine nucleotide exchange factor 39 [Platysternon megacephalum]
MERWDTTTGPNLYIWHNNCMVIFQPWNMQLPVLWFGVVISQSESSIAYNHHGPNYAWLLFGSTGEKAGHKERFLPSQPCVTQLKKRQFCSLCSRESRDCCIPSSPGTYGAPIGAERRRWNHASPIMICGVKWGSREHPIKATLVAWEFRVALCPVKQKAFHCSSGCEVALFFP